MPFHVKGGELKLRCRHTSGRTIFRPDGHDDREFVAEGNIMACRTVLMCYLANGLGLRYLVEQPSGSSMYSLRRFQELFRAMSVAWHSPRKVMS